MKRKRTTPPWIRQRNRRWGFAAVAIALCMPALFWLAAANPGRDATPVQAPAAVAASNVPSGGDFPNHDLTPGAAVEFDASVVCRPGYATSVRPEGELWRRLKDEAYDRYGLPRGHRSVVTASGGREAAYEVDHLVPLELGGSPADLRNLWPQPLASAKQKDAVEDELHELVCSGRMPLRQAQDAIATDWKTAVPGGSVP